MMNVVFHVSKPDQWAVALGNVRHLRQALPDCTIEVLVNGAVITMFRNLDDRLLSQLDSLKEQNAHVLLCRNALRANQIPEESLPADVAVVPAGVAALVEKQHQGYAYIKP